MSLEILSIVFVVHLGVLVFGLLALGGYLVTRDTIRKKGRWGLNTKPAKCRQCDTPAPVVRMPKNRNQMLWGGWTCAECGYELDKWGEPVAEQPFPAKWSAKMDDAPAIDDRIKRHRADIERKGDSHE
jgi:hypothetical protein